MILNSTSTQNTEDPQALQAGAAAGLAAWIASSVQGSPAQSPTLQWQSEPALGWGSPWCVGVLDPCLGNHLGTSSRRQEQSLLLSSAE